MLLQCKDLIKIYPSPVEGLNFPALRGLDFTVNQGELVSIIGPSGAGKTTLLDLISSFDIPSSGEIWFDGQLINNLTGRDLFEYRKKIGFMTQSPDENLFWGLSALDNVLFPMRYSGQNISNQKERAFKLLSRVGLVNKEHRGPSQLSGGEQQRVAIAVALANNPLLLLADEPTGELDSQTTSQIIDFFKELNEELGVTIIVATHDKRFSKMTEYTYKIQDGRLSSFYSKKKPSTLAQQEELVMIDSHRSLRLPEHIFTQFKDLSAVKVIVKDGKIELIPHDSMKSKERSDH